MDTKTENDDAYQKRKKVIILAATAVVLAVEQYRKYYLGKKSCRGVFGNQLRMSKRACSAVTSGRQKRRKVETDKVSSLLKAIATVISQLVMNDSPYELAKSLSLAIEAIPGFDFNKRWRAKAFFMKRKNLASIFLNASEEDKPKVLELCMSDSKDIIKDF